MFSEHKPINERILVKPVSPPNISKGGIVVPTANTSQSHYGKIIDMGEGRLLDDGTRVPFSVKVGDLVLFARRAGTEVAIEGEVHRFLTERDIFAVVQVDESAVVEVPELPRVTLH